MKTFIFLLSITLVIFTQIGCQTKEEPQTREKSLSTGFSLMDQNKYDEAITYFSDLLKVDKHYQVKMALASAYAGRAGVRIEQIYSFAVVREIKVPELNIGESNVATQSTNVFATIAKYVEHWKRIPDVKAPARDDLNSALDILSDETEPGARLYGATLRVVILKSGINEGVESFNARTANSKKICVKDIQPYVAWSEKVFDELDRLVVDLEFAFPEQKASYEENRAKLAEMKTQVTTMVWPPGSICY